MMARVTLPYTYCSILSFMASMVMCLLKIMYTALLPTQKRPNRKLKKTMSGIMGGMLILDAIIVSALLSRKRVASRSATAIWKPHMGTMPINTPNPMDNDRFCIDSSLLYRCLRKDSFTFFKRDICMIRSRGFIYNTAIRNNIVFSTLMREKSGPGRKWDILFSGGG